MLHYLAAFSSLLLSPPKCVTGNRIAGCTSLTCIEEM